MTQQDEKRLTHWNLPDEIMNLNISYHTKNSLKETYFKAASRGQEFVISPKTEQENNQLKNWVVSLIKKHSKNK